MRVFQPTKTGRGKCCAMYGRGRAVHSIKKGGYVPLLLSPGLGGAIKPQNKSHMNNVIRKLENLQLKDGSKKKNISFMI